MQKVHYNAVFGDGKREEKALNAEAQRKILGSTSEPLANFCGSW
jgi:hypothetical protein